MTVNLIDRNALKWVSLQILPPYSGINCSAIEITKLIFSHITNQSNDGADGGSGEAQTPTSTNIITGNVKKLNLPFQANIVAVSLGLEPEILGSALSDESTGNYTIDVYPHTSEVLLYVAPDYGRAFEPGLPVSTGWIIHPTVPNQYVYVAQNDGLIDLTEPNWPTTGVITSNEVDFLPVPLHKPLMNGFVKPVITPINS